MISGLCGFRLGSLSLLKFNSFSLPMTRLFFSQSANPYFERPKEKKMIAKLLQFESGASFITGPQDSGKSTLISQALQEINEKGKRNILHLDLRTRPIGAFDYFLNYLTEMFNKNFNELNLTVPSDSAGNLTKRLLQLLVKVDAYLDEQVGESPILIIDEAHKLLHLESQDNELHLFLNWLFNHSQRGSFRLVLVSHKSTFLSTIHTKVGYFRLTPYVIGYLSKSEAEKYWNQLIEKQKERWDKMSPPPFEEAYQACGGAISHLKRYLADYWVYEGIRPEQFCFVKESRDRLMRFFLSGKPKDHSEITPFLPRLEKMFAPQWNRDKFFLVTRKIVLTQGRFVPYEEACRLSGYDFVNEAIDANIFYLRYIDSISSDIENPPQDQPVLTAETPATWLAMKGIIRDYDQMK